MTLLGVISDAYLLATGKSVLPLDGSSKRNRLLNLAKKFYKDWQIEKGIDWDSLYSSDVTAGTVTATDTFDLDTEIHKVSKRDGDFVRVLKNGQYIPFKLVPASRLYENRYNNAVAHIGTTLKFSHVFTATDQVFGGIIIVPAYIKLDDLVNESDDVLIDDTAWLSVITAAQYVENDPQLSYQYPDLIAQANDKMTAMKLANGTPSDSYNTGENFFDNGGSF